ncbi:hypothetical protein O7626_18310 [Micromonospora sp. WMMD1102]|uniref:hypothetical protein n=1 Tax=Micromonospora sp. WMMD1102 TaxID=3016105 RepID=UPI0024158721|nr:hypothetical protein [Micromonospora sp. WMMD1102]MDG4787869.1 hypothetical protein [Micromonospora sp. WMMD1102]
MLSTNRGRPAVRRSTRRQPGSPAPTQEKGDSSARCRNLDVARRLLAEEYARGRLLDPRAAFADDRH